MELVLKKYGKLMKTTRRRFSHAYTGWPLDKKTYGGSFVYHAEKKQIYIGYVIGLDYQNPIYHLLMNFKDLKHIKILEKY